MAQCPVLIREGKDRVPLRFPRPIMALIATGIAAMSIGLSAVPASADQVRHKEWWLSSLGVDGALAVSQGAGVTVAVLSDGVDASQPDLTGAVTAGPVLPGAPIASGRYFGAQGTPIASLIAGRGHGSGGSSGIIGVAPEAKILSVPVTLPADDPQLRQSSVAAAIPDAIAAGIRYAVGHGASVIDLPIDVGQPGSSGTGGAVAAAGGNAAEQAAVSYALAHNVVLVAPAGDDGNSSDAPNYPAAYSGVIAVGAFNSAFFKAPWSSHQSYVTVTAAGAGVTAASNSGGYETMNSTSAASAIVSGVVALIRSRYPDLSVSQIRQALITTTVYHPAGGLADGSGYGTVNASKAIMAAALLATPRSGLAGARAEPLVAPAVPAGKSMQAIRSQLVKAGEKAGALLALLLVVIAVYATTRRRKRRRRPADAAEWAPRPTQSHYPRATAPDDRILEFLKKSAAAAQTPPEPGPPPVSVSEAEQSLFAPAAGRQAAGRFAASPPVGRSADSRPWRKQTAASRSVSGRPAVSGTPPWESAATPAGELPWAARSGGHAEGAGAGSATAPAGPAPAVTAPMTATAPAAEPEHAQPPWQPESAEESVFRPRDRRGDRDWRTLADRDADADWKPAAETAPAMQTSGKPDSGAVQPALPIRPRIARSGLPIRPTRRARPTPEPSSGSLWDPANTDGGGQAGDSEELGGPIYVWNPSAQPPANTFPVPPAELRRTLARRRIPD